MTLNNYKNEFKRSSHSGDMVNKKLKPKPPEPELAYSYFKKSAYEWIRFFSILQKSYSGDFFTNSFLFLHYELVTVKKKRRKK